MYLGFYHIERDLGRPKMHPKAYISQILDQNYTEWGTINFKSNVHVYLKNIHNFKKDVSNVLSCRIGFGKALNASRGIYTSNLRHKLC